MKKIFTEDFLKEIGFTLISEEKSYGSAKDRTGMTILYWNEDGHSCTYFGNKLDLNVSFSIRKDADTRTAFDGYVFSQDDVRRLLKLTW